MKKILVFYDSVDIDLARDVSDTIKGIGFSPWLADDHSKVDWHAELAELIPTDACAGAVVIWSQKSRLNPITRDEAKEIVKIHKPLVRMLMNGVEEAPLGLTDGPRLRFDGAWNGRESDRLKEKLVNVFGETHSAERALILNGKKLLAPSMVLSVSSFETQIEPDPTLTLLSQVNPPAVLVSAYDLLRPKPPSAKSTLKPRITNLEAIKSMRSNGSMVFLDSGNYEAMRNKDTDWQRGKKRLLEAQQHVDVDLAFTHDSFPPKTALENVCSQSRIDKISAEYDRDKSLINCAIAPIIHAPRLSNNSYCYANLPEICRGVVQAVNPPMIAVAERELGDGRWDHATCSNNSKDPKNSSRSKIYDPFACTGNWQPNHHGFSLHGGSRFF